MIDIIRLEPSPYWRGQGEGPLRLDSHRKTLNRPLTLALSRGEREPTAKGSNNAR